MYKKSRKTFESLKRIMLIVFMAALLAACAPQIQTVPIETEKPFSVQDLTPTNTSTPRATSTPTPTPLGSPNNPITMGFILQPEDSPAIEAAEDIAFLISDRTGYAVESLFYPDFSSYALAAQNGDIHLLWLSPLEYLYLNDSGIADAFIMTNHLGVYAYGVQFLANTFRGFTPYFDPQQNESVGTAVQALQQFSGTRPCFINDESLPGYFVPLGFLSNTSTPTIEPVFVYGYSAIIRALYIQGICDFGVTYALTGDPRSASDVLQDLPEAREIVTVIWQSDGIIPNTSLSSSPDLPENIQFQLKEAIIDLQDHPEGLSLLSLALDYEIEALKSINDSFYDPFRGIIAPLYLDLAAITQN